MPDHRYCSGIRKLTCTAVETHRDIAQPKAKSDPYAGSERPKTITTEVYKQ